MPSEVASHPPVDEGEQRSAAVPVGERPTVSASVDAAFNTDVRLRTEPTFAPSPESLAVRATEAVPASGRGAAPANEPSVAPGWPPPRGLTPAPGSNPSALSERAPGGAAAYLGAVIDGRYVVEALLGEGGMGFVYRCRHQLMDKLVAIKILRQEIARDPEVMLRFVNEARAASAIGNPHIVQTVDFGQLPDGATYFAMEYLEGQNLTELLAREPVLPLERVLDIGKQVAEALGAAHDADIVHRDLKPDNVFIVKKGRTGSDFIKILDFGIAKVASAQNKLTRAGTVFGTPHYMSPEQARGTDVDPRTDVYALGVMLYEMAVGRVPFDAESPMSILSQHLHEPPTPPSRAASAPQPFPEGLEAVILKCLAKQPEQRYQNMAELGADLEQLQAGLAPAALLDAPRVEAPASIPAPPLSSAPPPALPDKSRRHYMIAIAALCAIIGAGGALVAAQPKVSGTVPAVFRRSVPSNTDLLLQLLSRTEQDVQPAPMRDGSHEVALIMLPIDAEAYLGEERLGAMPVTVRVPLDETVTVTVRREHYYARRVVVDGKKARVVVRLTPIPSGRPTPETADAGAKAASGAPAAAPSGAKGQRGASAASALPDVPLLEDYGLDQVVEPSSAAPPAAPSTSARAAAPSGSAAPEPAPSGARAESRPGHSGADESRSEDTASGDSRSSAPGAKPDRAEPAPERRDDVDEPKPESAPPRPEKTDEPKPESAPTRSTEGAESGSSESGSSE